MPWDKRVNVTIYTDGSCSCNPGPGGWAAIVMCNNKYKRLTGNALHTTNNRMELTAVIEGIKYVSVPANIRIVTDSTYVMVDKGKWNKMCARKKLPNKELWAEFIKAAKDGNHSITYEHVYGHTGHEFNEMANELAQQETSKAKAAAFEAGIRYEVNHELLDKLNDEIRKVMNGDDCDETDS